MRLFRRSKKTNTTAVPAEIQEYYNAEQRERVGLAWLIAIISLVISLAVIFGIFFGGRYIYRKYIHKSKTGTSSTSTNNSNGSDKLPGGSNTTEDKSKDNGVTQPSSPSTPSTSTPSTGSNSGTTGTTTQPGLAHTGPDNMDE